MSLIWDPRSVLFSAASATSSPGAPSPRGAEAELDRPVRLGVVHIWNYLVSLSQGGDKNHLVHFNASSFDKGWDGVPQHLGQGASYSVDKCTLRQRLSDGTAVCVAVKRLNVFRDARAPGQGTSAGQHHFLTTVLKELRILTHAPLRTHPNIVTLLGYSSEFVSGVNGRGTDVSLVVELASHGTLQDLCKVRAAENRPLDLLTKMQLMLDIASGLSALHEHGIAHGDVKMENTLVFDGSRGRGYTAKLSDFGHALVDLHRDGLPPQTYLGTAVLNAPEVRTRSSTMVDRSAEAFYLCDTYSFGLLVWETVLDGARFCSELEPLVPGQSGEELILRLNALPKDELLLCALKTRSVGCKVEESNLSRTLSGIFHATLRDDPADRKSTAEITRMLLRQSNIDVDPLLNDRMVPRRYAKSNLPALKMEELAALTPTDSALRMPLAVQAGFVAELEDLAKAARSQSERTRALYELAICSLTGFGGDGADLGKALRLLEDAARLGSSKAASLLYCLGLVEHQEERAGPPSWDAEIPSKDAETRLTGQNKPRYMVTHLRGLESTLQQEAMAGTFHVLYQKEILLCDISMQDVQGHLSSEGQYELEHLSCVQLGQSSNSEMVPLQGTLLAVAARLGLLSLMEYLLALPPTSQESSRRSGLSSGLSAACQGGHADPVRLLLTHGAQPSSWGTRPTLHWLSFIPDDEIADIFGRLSCLRGGKADLHNSVSPPGLDMQHFRLQGTPLEVAIGLNDKLLVDLIIANADAENQFESIGWTETTFRLAASLHVHSMLPDLIDIETSYRRSHPEFHATARYRASQGKPELPPFGLFDLAYPCDPMLPLLIHGPLLQVAIESTMDKILASRICAINDQDADGYTALFHALRFAPCHLNTHLISALLGRGAGFGHDWTPGDILANIAKRRDQATAKIVRLLLDAGLLLLNMGLLVSAVSCNDPSIVKAVLGFADSQGRKLDVNERYTEPGNESDTPVHILYFAVGASKGAETIRVLLDAGADIDATFEDKTLLHAAILVADVDLETIDVLIDGGAPLALDGGFTILHQAAYVRGTSDSIHVMFHLLSHARIRALMNDLAGEPGGAGIVSPLHFACFACVPGAAHALLQAGALMPIDDQLASLMEIAVGTGRRPESSPVWLLGRDQDEEAALYEWRLDMEDIVFALLAKGDPGHGRTSLHVAAELGNYRRVVELVEHERMSVRVGDRDRLLPAAYLEDMDMLKEAGETQAYVDNVNRIEQYLGRKILEEMHQDVQRSGQVDVVEQFISHNPPSDLDTPENQRAHVELGARLAKLRVERDEVEFSVGNGLESPAERAAKLQRLVEEQSRRLGADHLGTLRTKTSLCSILLFLGRVDDAERVQLEVLRGRQEQLAENHQDLYEAKLDRVCVLSYREMVDKAHDLVLEINEHAIDRLGIKHPVTLEVSGCLGGVQSLRGDLEPAIRTLESARHVYQEMDLDSAFARYPSGPAPLARVHLKCSLAICYLRQGRFGDASELARPLACQLRFAYPKDFLSTFMSLVSDLGTWLDACLQYDDAEHVYTTVLGDCLKVHGKRKSWCVQTILQQLASHYRARLLWEKEVTILQKQLHYVKSVMGLRDSEAVDVMILLADALDKQQRWAESVLLRQQIIMALDLSSATEHPQAMQCRLAVCRTLRHLEQLDESERWARETLELCRSRLEEHDDVARKAEYELGETLAYAGKSDEAIETKKHHVQVAAQYFGQVHHKTRFAVESLTSTLMRLGRHEEALGQALRCFEISRQIPETNGRIMGNSLHVLATARDNVGQHAEAIEAYIRAIDEEKRYCNGELSDDSLTSMRALAALHIHQGQFSEAEPLLRDVLSAAPGSGFANEHKHLLMAHRLMGSLFAKTARIAETVEHTEAALVIAQQTHGDISMQTTDCRSDVVGALLSALRYKDAHGPALEVLRERRERLGEYHEETLQAKLDLCLIYPMMGMWPQAERLQRNVLRKLEAGGEHSLRVCELFERLSESCRRMDKYDEAADFGRRAMEWRIREHGEDSEDGFASIVNMGYSYVDDETWDKAEEISRQALAIASRSPGENLERLTSAECLQAYLYYYQDRPEEAIVVQRRIVERQPNNQNSLQFLASIYTDAGRYSEAADVAEQSLGLIRADSGEGGAGRDKDRDAADVMVKLTKIYTSMEQWHKAKDSGEQAREATAKFVIQGIHEDMALALRCLQALRPVYEALCEEQKLFELVQAIKTQEETQEKHRQGHLISMAYEEHIFKTEQSSE